MPLSVELLGALLGLAFFLGALAGAGLVWWRLPHHLAGNHGELDSLAIRVLELHKRRLERQARRQRGRHLQPVKGPDRPG